MKFICNAQDLSTASNIVSKILAVKSNIPILDGIKIKATEDKVSLSVYNQEIYIEKEIRANVLMEGELIVEGRLFNDFVSRISPKEDVEIEKIDDEKISLKFNVSDIQLQCYEKENFPDIGEYSATEYFEIKEKELKELIDRALSCAALINNRIMLKSCSFKVEEDEVEAVCLDGFRIAVSRKKVISQNGNIQFIVLAKLISDIFRTLEDSEDIIKISKEKNMIMFDKGHTKIKVNTVEGEFYNYKVNIPTDIKNELIINKDELDDCLKRAAVICRDTEYNKLILSISNNMLNIRSESEKGKINENIKCKNEGENIKLGLNCKYIQEAISKIKEDFLTIIIERPTKPILIQQIKEEEYRCIVLPLRLIG